MGFFNDLVTLNLDLYSSNTRNLLTLRELPEITGLGTYWSNGGSMTNKGYELGLNIKLLNTPELQWEVGMSAGSYKNKVTSLPDNKSYTVNVLKAQLLTEVGQPLGMFYGYKTNGVFASDAAAQTANLRMQNADGTFSNFGAGDMIFVDLDGNGIINEKDKQVLGSAHPELYGNFNTTVNYKSFSFSALLTYSLGNDIYNFRRHMLESGSDFSNQTKAMLRRWTGDGQNTDIPRAVFGDPMGNARFSDRWIEDGSYLKLKNIAVSYDLPIKNNYIEGLKVWVSAENLFTWSRYLGLDPEVAIGNRHFSQGIDAGLIPQTRGYYVGIKLNL